MSADLVAWLLGIAAIATGLIAIGTVAHRMWKVIGWHGTLWAWVARFVATVDVVQSLPITLAGINATIKENGDKLEEHLIDAKTKMELLTTIDHRTTAMLASVEDVRYEVKNNGGGSTKDAVDRIELGVAGLYARPGEAGQPGREDHREQAAAT